MDLVQLQLFAQLALIMPQELLPTIVLVIVVSMMQEQLFAQPVQLSVSPAHQLLTVPHVMLLLTELLSMDNVSAQLDSSKLFTLMDLSHVHHVHQAAMLAH